METVNSVVSAASKAIFGEQENAEERTAHNETSGEEPASGMTGAGKADEPFDKGNLEPTTATATEATLPPPIATTETAPQSTAPTQEAPQTGGVLIDSEREKAEKEKAATAPEPPAEPLKLAEDAPAAATAPVKAAEPETPAQLAPVVHPAADLDAPKPAGEAGATIPAAATATKTTEEKAEEHRSPSGSSANSETKKASKMARLKEKLHIGSSKSGGKSS